jgi:hypothetical protein
VGHQINFYALPKDVLDMEEQVRRFEPIAILHSRSTTSGPRPVASTQLTEDGLEWLFFYLVRKPDIYAVAMEHVPAQRYWTVDVLASPVVELARCHFDGRALRRGRMFYVDRYLSAEGTWVEKPDSFRTWAKKVLGVARKCFRKQGAEYMGREALRWLQESGGKLVS